MTAQSDVALVFLLSANRAAMDRALSVPELAPLPTDWLSGADDAGNPSPLGAREVATIWRALQAGRH